MNMNARKYQNKVITYSLSKGLSNRLEAGSFHGYKFIMWIWELEVAYSNSEVSAHECSEYYKRWVKEYYKFCRLHNKMGCL